MEEPGGGGSAGDWMIAGDLAAIRMESAAESDGI
jgi:hypothetical protein